MEAARALHGLKSVELDALLNEHGFGKYDSGRIERGEMDLTKARRRALAEILEVPESWFTEETLDLTSAEASEPVDLTGVEAHLAVIAQKLSAQEAARADAFRDLYARVQRNEAMLERVLSLLEDAQAEAGDPPRPHVPPPGPPDIGETGRALQDGPPRSSRNGDQDDRDQGGRKRTA
jgi:transcriptional regulator with XRE-family HTH domain